ncbi:RNA-binding, CRM domain protein [Actinidia chinensis var. chinensis]|uniref:RNA-binding, CRM domain protein n=1 Tax=Actinidia chinensis var. chinensis TaxID=1590841 RepID=A0A2R6P754_ACTCC|nr:RNA-binding, CRM domain protein [Actinidia chinensis var. chinensis]
MVTRALCKSQQLRYLLFNPVLFAPTLNTVILQNPRFCDVCKVFGQEPSLVPPFDIRRSPFWGALWIHSDNKVVDQPEPSGSVTGTDGVGDFKKMRKKLKGKRAVVKWLKFFRWKKKKEYERMTEEEKILYKMSKARKKEERLVEALKKIEPKETSETTHDPEILTPEEHFYFLKMGVKCKNYVPVGRRGIYQGVILNMHLHWKKHQTLQVVVKTFSEEEVKEIAAELARLSGGIVLDIREGNTIIMYRGKNYSQPPTEIMSPRITLSRKKALDKSKHRDGLRAVRKFIPRLEQDLELLRAKLENKPNPTEETNPSAIDSVDPGSISNPQLEKSDKLRMLMAEKDECPKYDSTTESGMDSDSEDLSDIFETDCDSDNEGKKERPLYLDEFDKFPAQTEGEIEDFEAHLRQVSAEAKKAKSMGKDEELPDLDEVDRMFLQAASLLRKKRSKR